jgi:hypothetical protein
MRVWGARQAADRSVHASKMECPEVSCGRGCKVAARAAELVPMWVTALVPDWTTGLGWPGRKHPLGLGRMDSFGFA